MTNDKEFEQSRLENISRLAADEKLARLTSEWLSRAQLQKYSYNFDWLGLPMIQYPQDIVAMQEIVWRLRPDLIIETGVARGGSVIFYSSMLELVASCGGGEGTVLAVDIDIREMNLAAINAHPMSKRIELLQGSSTDPDIVAQVKHRAKNCRRILICLDSNHTHDHVLKELRAYADLTSVGSYIVVFDTFIEDLMPEAIGDRSWGAGNNPKTAVREFLRGDDRYEIDKSIHDKLRITAAPDGFLRRIR